MEKRLPCVYVAFLTVTLLLIAGPKTEAQVKQTVSIKALTLGVVYPVANFNRLSRPPRTSHDDGTTTIGFALVEIAGICTFEKMRAKWFCGLVAVSRFFCFPIQMNFAENKKWPTRQSWRAAH